MTKKIFRSTVAVGLAVLLASLVIIMGALYTYFGHVQEQQLRDELSIAAAAMESGDGEAYLSKLHSDNYRITWLRADGTVLYDTKADAAAMENHAQREEVRQALADADGYNAVLIDVKSPLGNFYYSTDIADAQTADADIAACDALIKELTETPDLIVIARVPAFSDPNFVAKHYSSARRLQFFPYFLFQN